MYYLSFIFLFFLICEGFAQGEQVPINTLTVAECLAIAKQKEQLGDRKEATRYLNQAATIEWEKKNFNPATQYFEESLRLNEQINNETGIIAIYNNLGMIYADQMQYEKSLNYFQKNLAGRRQLGDKYSITSALINTSVVLNNLRRYSESAIYLEEALDYARERYDIPQMRSCYGMLAETYEKAGNLDKTIYYFNLYRSFHEMVQKEREKKYQKTAEEARLEARLLEMEKRNKELELIDKNQELAQKQTQIKEFSAANYKLLQNLNKQELINFVLKNEADLKKRNAEIKELQNQKSKSQIEIKLNRNREIINYLIISILALIISGFILYRRNQEKKKTNKILEQQKQELKEINQAKDKLFSIIAHDLRSPFNALHGLLILLEGKELDESETVEIVKSLQKTTRNTLETLETLLNWAVTQIKGVHVNPEIINLHRKVEEKIDFFKELAQKKHISLQNDTASNLSIQADINHVDIILRNLIANAIKFTPYEGLIAISSIEHPEMVEIKVKDSGVGIKPENLQKLFKLEQHFTTRGTEREQGSGLGLLLCKEFVEKNGGHIEVSSELDKGTTFSFTLPKAQVPLVVSNNY